MYDIALAKPVQISGVSDGMSAPVSASFNPSFVAGLNSGKEISEIAKPSCCMAILVHWLMKPNNEHSKLAMESDRKREWRDHRRE